MRHWTDDTVLLVYSDPNQLRQIAIRRVLRLNAKKKLSGKYRGLKWIRARQAECAIYGHDEVLGGCRYCGASLV